MPTGFVELLVTCICVVLAMGSVGRTSNVASHSNRKPGVVATSLKWHLKNLTGLLCVS